MTDEEERDFKNWCALMDACNKSHKGGAGGAAICVCGAGGGGSSACSMLGKIKNIIRHMPTEKLPTVWRDQIESLRKII